MKSYLSALITLIISFAIILIGALLIDLTALLAVGIVNIAMGVGGVFASIFLFLWRLLES